MPLEQHLKAINENALSQFEKIDPNTIVPFIERYTTPQRVEMFGPPQPSNFFFLLIFLILKKSRKFVAIF